MASRPHVAKEADSIVRPLPDHQAEVLGHTLVHTYADRSARRL